MTQIDEQQPKGTRYYFFWEKITKVIFSRKKIYGTFEQPLSELLLGVL